MGTDTKKKATHPKGSVEIKGVWYSPALQNIMKATGEWPPGGASATTAGGSGSMKLPDTAALIKAGLSETLAKEYGSKSEPITVSTTTNYPSAADLVSAVDQLPPSVGRAVAKAIGLNDESLGTSESERAASVVKYYPSNGNLSELNPTQMQPYSTPPKTLTTAGVTGATGSTTPASENPIPAAAKQFIDATLKDAKIPINKTSVGAMSTWIQVEQGAGFTAFEKNKGNPLGIQTPAAQASGAAGTLLEGARLTAQELLTPAYATLRESFLAPNATIESIATQIVGSSWSRTFYGGMGVGNFLTADSTGTSGAANPASINSGQVAVSGTTQYEQYTSIANADNYLINWGIDTPEMNALVNNLVAHGVVNQNEILQNVRQTATYKQAFAGLAEYNAVPGHVHMTESEYRTYSQSVLGAAQQYGVPSGFMTQDEIGTLLKGNVSAPEFQQRVEDIYAATSNANPGTKALLQKWYGVGPGALTAYFANPQKALTVLQRQVASAEIGNYASRVGLSGLTEKGAQQLAQQAKLTASQGNNQLGTGVTSIENSLLNASKDSALLASNPGAQKPILNTNELIGSQVAGFSGTNQVAAETAVERAEQAKAAPFESGGGFAQSEKGVTGLGSASS